MRSGTAVSKRGSDRARALVATVTVGVALAACGTASASEIPVSTTSASESASVSPSASGDPGGPPPGGGSSTPQYTPTGAYTLTSGTATKSGSVTATANDESGVLVTGGSLTLNDAQITTSGNSSSADESSFYGLNAGVLATGGGIVTMRRGSVTTTGSGANGVFAYGPSAVTLYGTRIKATGEYAHGIMTSGGGTITAYNLTVETSGGSSAPVATDRGGGTVTVYGGTYRCSGNNSPGLYSTGAVTANNASFVATGSEVAVVEGANSITLNNSELTAQKAGKWGVMIYQSMSGDASGTRGTYTQTGGSLSDTATDSPLFFVTNSTGVITLSKVRVAAASGVLVKAAAAQWGASGTNGGTALLTASGQVLAGSVVADAISAVTLTLKDRSTLDGAIDATDIAGSATLVLDASSTWTVAADSHLTVLTGAQISGNTVRNITGRGHTVTYDASDEANSYLGGKTYTLADGGSLLAE